MNTTNTTTDLHGAAKRPEAGKSGIPGLGARAGRILDIMIGNRGTFFMAMLALLIVVVTMSVLFTVVQVQSRTRYVIASADARLLVAAEFSREVLGADYHDRLQGEDSLSPEAYQAVVSRNNDLCRRLGLQYLWSVLVLDDRIVFTSATRTDLNDPGSRFANFFETHADPNAFAPALGPSLEPVYATFTNEWGQGRMVLVPGQDAQGRR